MKLWYTKQVKIRGVRTVYKMCKTEQSAQRQRQLERGLLQAMGSQHYDEISVSDLCQQIGVPRKSFYRYFSGKDGALHALIDHTLMEYEGFEYPGGKGEQRSYQKDLEEFFLFWRRQKPLLDALTRSGLSGVLIEQAIDHALSEVGAPQRFLTQHAPELRAHATMFAVCGLMSMVVTWHHDNYFQDPRQMAGIAEKLVTEPLFTAPRD